MFVLPHNGSVADVLDQSLIAFHIKPGARTERLRMSSRVCLCVDKYWI